MILPVFDLGNVSKLPVVGGLATFYRRYKQVGGNFNTTR